MDSRSSSPSSGPAARAVPYLPEGDVTLVKFVVVGPFAVGKTTFIGSLSDYAPLSTEEPMTQAGADVDHLRRAGKTETTVAMDFGRITLQSDLVAYLFGAPGQDRFQPLWDEMTYGALGALVLADTHRLEDSFQSMDRLEELHLPYVVAVNDFAGNPRYEREELRYALQLDPDTPLEFCDARERISSKQVLVTLVRHLMTRPRPLQEPL